ncbi:MAG: 2-C-methyl-D-erythritol 4-phosphate cytidylyltransferase [Candidatus Omnitrophica bacterium]|nr:2-C-methyl-D-erythritol 4-phosphate cytidylyltransferase [Candidatus Omnitrophota bacterium]
MSVALIVPAAGQGRRFGSRVPKTLARLGRGRALLVLTLERLSKAYAFDPVVVPVEAARIEVVSRLLKSFGLSRARVVAGGRTRAESVLRGLESLPRSSRRGWVAVHDAARPLVDPPTVRRCIRDARRYGAAILAQPCHATVKRSDPKGLRVQGTEDRSRLYLAQTPQIFKVRDLMGRYSRLGPKALTCTDEAALFDGTGKRIRITRSGPSNIKITTKADLDFYTFYSARRSGSVS